MLWRAGSGHRNFIHTVSFKNSLYHLPFRWFSLPAHFMQTPSSQAPLNDANLPHFRFTGKVSRYLLSRFPIETAVYLSMIEDLFATNASRDTIFARLKVAPSDILSNSKHTCIFAQEMVKATCPERAVHILHIAHQMGIVLAHNQYEQVAYQLATRHHWRYVQVVTTMARKMTGSWTVRLLNWAVRSYIETQNYGFLDAVLDEFKRHHLIPTQRTYHLLVRGHLQNSDLNRARSCLVQMQASGIEMNKSTFFTVLGAYRSLGPNNAVETQALQALQGTRDRSDTMIFNGLLKMRIDDGDTAGVSRALKLVALSLNAEGGGASKHRGQECVMPHTSPKLMMFSSLPPTILPDNTTFNILLRLLARHKGELHNVLRVLRQMGTTGLCADTETATAILLAYSKANMTGSALEMVYEMCKRHNIPVDRNEFRRLGYLTETVGVDVLQTCSPRPDTGVFNALLQAVLPEHGLTGVQRVLRIMRQASVLPDASTTQIILSYLHNQQNMHTRSLILVLRKLSAFPTDHASLTMQHINAILRSILCRELEIIRTSSWNSSAQRLRLGHFSHFSSQHLFRVANRFDPMAGIPLSSFQRRTRTLFEPMVQALIERQVMSDRMTFALRIRRDAVVKLDIESARHVFEIMVARGIRANAYHYSALMEGYAALGNMKGARGVLFDASQAGVGPNVIMYTILIQGYGRLGRPDLARQTFGAMVNAGVHPDHAAVDAVVGAYWFVRAYKSARTLLLDLWPLIAPFPTELQGAPLRVLVQYLRASRKGSRIHVLPIESPHERQRRKALRRKIGHTLSDLEQWQQVAEAVSWAKADVGLGYMVHADSSSTEGKHDWF